MKKKWPLISSIIQLIIGVAAALTIVLLAFNGEDTAKWTITLILSVAFIVLGIWGIIDYKRK